MCAKIAHWRAPATIPHQHRTSTVTELCQVRGDSGCPRHLEAGGDGGVFLEAMWLDVAAGRGGNTRRP